MTFNDDLKAEIGKILAESWTMRDGQKVPETADIQLGNDAVKLQGTVLYADLAESTDLVMRYQATFAGKVYKVYLSVACKLIRHCEGVITAFDGDRVMAVFRGDKADENAVRAAFAINHAVTKLINPAIRGAKGSPPDFVVRQAVGIDSSPLVVARTGIRGANDLVWIGRAANYAAKLCGLREDAYATYITKAVFDKLPKGYRLSGNGQALWEQRQWTARKELIYRSTATCTV